MKLRRALVLVLTLVLAGTAFVIGTAPARADGAIRVAVAGDSLTAHADSWRYQLNDPGITFTGGYARGGYTTGDVLKNISESDADVLVVMLGTNDVRHDIPVTTAEANIEKIVAVSHPAHVLLTYLPPSDGITDTWHGVHIDARYGNLAYSRAFVALAAKHGWLIADPFTPWRSWNGAYYSRATLDGLHPSTAVFRPGRAEDGDLHPAGLPRRERRRQRPRPGTYQHPTRVPAP